VDLLRSRSCEWNAITPERTGSSSYIEERFTYRPIEVFEFASCLPRPEGGN